MTRMTRRRFLFRVAPLGLAGAAVARPAGAGESCAGPESESLRASLNYTATAADPASTCAHCAFFTADPPGGACGQCTILGGPVDRTGRCDSFSPPS
jgi:hypothetical protein